MATEVDGTSPSIEQRKTQHHRKLKDLAGQVFSRLTVIDRAPNRIKRSGIGVVQWNCRCECGKLTIVDSGKLVGKRTKSCGCLNIDTPKLRTGKNNPVFRHGMAKSMEYRSWQCARKRVIDKNNKGYPAYGGRGIKMSDEWIDSPETFLADMGKRPKGTTLERIDNDGHYCAENCRWASQTEQARNRRSTVRFFARGEEKTAAEWSEISGIPWKVIWARIRLWGWDYEKAIFEPVNRTAGRFKKK